MVRLSDAAHGVTCHGVQLAGSPDTHKRIPACNASSKLLLKFDFVITSLLKFWLSGIFIISLFIHVQVVSKRTRNKEFPIRADIHRDASRFVCHSQFDIQPPPTTVKKQQIQNGDDPSRSHDARCKQSIILAGPNIKDADGTSVAALQNE